MSSMMRYRLWELYRRVSVWPRYRAAVFLLVWLHDRPRGRPSHGKGMVRDEIPGSVGWRRRTRVDDAGWTNSRAFTRYL